MRSRRKVEAAIITALMWNIPPIPREMKLSRTDLFINSGKRGS